jgi:hypothetical protein
MKKNTFNTGVWLSGLSMLFMLLIFVACSFDENDEEEAYLSFTAPSPVAPDNPGEMAKIAITARGGTLPYVFYVIPETQWQAGDKMYEMLLNNDFSRLYLYAYTRGLYGSHNFVAEVQPGTQAQPRYYWVAVQDAAEHASVSGTNLLSWWKRVAAHGD